uniref:WDR19 first beta-propeller domain-containing protein n=1 Tax=Amphimedon queenslandica TaxID=400682 RepID=A0A1X7TDQ9_AMPQE
MADLMKVRSKEPILGKHSKRITSRAWSDQNVLALTGEDRKVTFSDQDGNSIGQREIKFEVHSLKFSPDGAMLSAVGDVQILYFFELNEAVIPLELIFE